MEELDLGQTIRGLRVGQTVFRRYTLMRILGRGGMGIVWLAEDGDLEREVALKFLPEVLLHDRSALRGLKRETTRSLALTHPHIVRIYDFMNDEQAACISMEYVDGETLSNLRSDKPNDVFEPNEIEGWVRELCDALHYAHEKAQIVHRDLKPANLMVNSRGDLKIADFGIARSLSDSVSMLTMSGGTSGTLVYMSPQQLNGEPHSHFDDLYSVGATLYDLLTSKPPFYSGQIDLQIRERPPVSVSQRRADLGIEAQPIPQRWEQTIAACLAKDPRQRPASAAEIARALGLSSTSLPPAATGPASPPIVTTPKNNTAAKLVTALVVVTICFAIGYYARLQRLRSERRPREAVLTTPVPEPERTKPQETARPVAAVTITPSPVSPTPSDTSLAGSDGIPDGATFGIPEVTVTDTPDPAAETNIKLKISVKARPNTPIDHTKVKIQVFFYDTVDNKEVVLTDADVSYEWLTPRHDWLETNPEVLAVTYLRVKNKNPTATGHRKYLGYIVRIYYNEQLQAVRADPTRLLNLFPPPTIAPQ